MYLYIRWVVHASVHKKCTTHTHTQHFVTTAVDGINSMWMLLLSSAIPRICPPPPPSLLVQSITEQSWSVNSQSTSSNTASYIVTACQVSCRRRPCVRACTQPACVFVCRHMYSCTCKDYEFGHLCKHVHAVHQYCQRVTKRAVDATGWSLP